MWVHNIQKKIGLTGEDSLYRETLNETLFKKKIVMELEYKIKDGIN